MVRAFGIRQKRQEIFFEKRNRKMRTPRPGLEPGSKAPQASRISTTLPGPDDAPKCSPKWVLKV
jgi:hypothetical protein